MVRRAWASSAATVLLGSIWCCPAAWAEGGALQLDPSTRPGAPSQGADQPGGGAPSATPPTSETKRPVENLGEQLSRSGGVIRPAPGVDPKMEKPPPDTGSQMPVIPPPGSPGGDPKIIPK